MLTMGKKWYHCLVSVVIALCYGGKCKITHARTVRASEQSAGTFLSPSHETALQDPLAYGVVSRYDPSVKSPCSVEDIPSSSDVFVNCQNRNISRIDPRWFPANTTILNLDSNNIHKLENNTFFHLRLLQNLSICCSNVKEIQINTLRGLRSLTYLNLEYNKLPLKYGAFPKTMFVHVPNLRHLLIQRNTNMDSGTDSGTNDKIKCSEVLPYSNYIDIFDLDLETLSIDIFPHVCIGEEFSRFQNLKNLQLCGPVSRNKYVFLTNDTFWGLRNVTLYHLSISGFGKPIHTELGLFQHLHNLESLEVTICHFGNQFGAKLLWPFVNRTMSFLHLNIISIHYDLGTPDNVLEDGIIRKETTEFLRKICVADFAWVNSKLVTLEPEAFNSPTWRRCLRKAELSSKDFVSYWKVSMFDVISFHALESITISSAVPDGTSYHIDAEIPDNSTQQWETLLPLTESSVPKYFSVNIDGENKGVKVDRKIKRGNNSDDYVSTDTNNATKSLEHHGVGISKSLQADQDLDLYSDFAFSQEHDKSGNRKFNDCRILMWIPRKLNTFQFVHITDNQLLAGKTTIILKGTDNLVKVYATHMPNCIINSARILGLEQLKLLDLSYSGIRVRQDFFDDFPGIEILVLRSLFPKNYFDTIMPCKQVIRKMSKLRYLDISNNGLTFLLPGTFSTNPGLKQINLSDNRFSSIPFELQLTPKLTTLDLSHNAILYLDEAEIAAIEAHVAKVDAFYLKLEGNGLVCVCSQMKFLVWLDRTSAILDKDGNYSCTSQDGMLSYTVSKEDLLGFWRQCNGWSWLMTSIVLALVLLVSFLTTYLTARFRCAIKAFMLRLMFPQFRPLTPQDYKTDVIVCYADDDYRFVRNILLGFLENELKLRTHVHQRDLPVGGHWDDHIHQAIENSWRIMLLITDTFLNRYDMADIMMKFACYAVGPANQGRVFALVEQGQDDKIPGNLHAVLEDDRIILINNMNDPLGYEEEQSIKNCLRPVN